MKMILFPLIVVVIIAVALISFAVVLNMKKKKRSKEFIKSTKTIATPPKTKSPPKTNTTPTTTDFYLPDDCWERVFKFIVTNKFIISNEYRNKNRDNYLILNSLSLVSKQFLSITDSLRFSLAICTPTVPFLDQLFKRFTNLSSLYLSSYYYKLDVLFSQIACFQLNITSIILRHKPINPANVFLIANCFPNLQQLNLTGCSGMSDEGITHVLRICCNITHLNLSSCRNVKLRGMNFEVLKLETLDLSCSSVDDETLYVISKYCRGLLQLSLQYNQNVTEKGVKHLVENCTQLREIKLEGCYKVHSSLLCYTQPSLLK
ncbi:putative leucine-rich repeat domain, L domain-containing protein [Medicago truncatula]|uniref:Putative leucine-rich repeat domain, L domain-containing protein n=1 Tax=Medicago truncatula TaxID=3880 RepID=G7JVN5_MEDTR|nr:transmembrane protein, putative [Medicago truncatula]RHN58302.1 putative leucine-rich repeat domain, L domain-containing protein [Medicago truncatula]